MVIFLEHHITLLSQRSHVSQLSDMTYQTSIDLVLLELRIQQQSLLNQFVFHLGRRMLDQNWLIEQNCLKF